MDYEELKNNQNTLYGYISENYYKWSKEELKELLLNAVYVANNDKKIIDETLNRL